jgi:VanZ family protein
MLFITLIFVVLLAAIVITADLGKLPVFITILYNFPGGDKAGHFILMGILNLLAIRLVLARNPAGSWRQAALTGLVVTTLAALEEFSQRFFPYRHASWGDFASSLAGIVVFGLIAWLSTNYGQRRDARARK